MDLQQVLSVLGTIGTIVLGALSIYLQTSKKAQNKAKEVAEKIGEITGQAIVFIAEAEKEYKDYTGGEKFQKVVDQLYDLVPEGINMIITREMIEEIVQSTFDEVKRYTTAKLDETVNKVEVK